MCEEKAAEEEANGEDPEERGEWKLPEGNWGRRTELLLPVLLFEVAMRVLCCVFCNEGGFVV